MYIPFLAHPLGWVVLGVGGYALYRTGKKKGQQGAVKKLEEPASSTKTENEAKTTTAAKNAAATTAKK